MDENSLVFTPKNADVVIKFAKSTSAFKDAINSSTHWNQMLIKNGKKFDRDLILRTIVDFVYPQFLFPVLYQESEDDTYFLFRNGLSAVMVLLNRQLRVVHPETNEDIELQITAHYKSFEDEPFDPSHQLVRVVEKRVSGEYIVDLRNLRNDPGMKHIFCDLRSITFVDVLLTCVEREIDKAWTKCQLLLCNNNIANLKVLQSLSNNRLALLDLRNNKISRRDFSSAPKNLATDHLLIDGNPVASFYTNVSKFARELRKYINTSMLDFVPIHEGDYGYVTAPSFVIKPSHIQFVDHFMFHYFGFFANDRDKLKEMYEENACLSVTLFKCKGKYSTSNSSTSLLEMMVDTIDRNLLSHKSEKIYVSTSKYDNLFKGKAEVAEGLSGIPKLAIEYSSMTVDAPMNEERMVMISCNGRCQASSGKIYLFSKVCVLIPSESTKGEWKISNDMWTFTIAPTVTHNIINEGPPNNPSRDFAAIINPQITDKVILTRIIKNLTKMKLPWVEKFLEEADWDLEFTLQSFTDQLKADIIPIEAFDIPPENLKILSPLIDNMKEKQAQLMKEAQTF